MDIEQEYGERLTPIEKLITNERLSYLPNLYYQLYRTIEKLSLVRLNFPEQKLLVERKKTQYDYFLQQMRQKQFILNQELKLKKVMAYQLAKAAKEEALKRSLKKQQKYLFQRVVFSNLIEVAVEKIKGQISQTQAKIPEEKANDVTKKTVPNYRPNNDIFIDKDSQVSNQNNDFGDNLFEDLLYESKPVEQTYLKPQPQTQNISVYLQELTRIQRLNMSEGQRFINRKHCMKKINQNLRKRIKNKSSDDSQERNLSSATVLITSLIGQQTDPRNYEDSIQISFFNDYLTNVEGKMKRKKEENFELKWDQQTLQKFIQMNPKFDSTKTKFGSNFLLLALDKKQYSSYFDKNIQTRMTFPSSIRSIPNISNKFQQKYYYNTFIDPQYEKFIMKHNKQKVFEKFKQISKFVLDNSYQLDIEGNSNINMAKMFLTSEGPMNDRVIYRLNSNRTISAVSLPIESLLTRAQLSELSFIVRKYLGAFGSNWRLISLFVSTHPTFSNMFLSSEQIQQLSQICKKNNNKQSILNADSFLQKNLPFSIHSASISKSYYKLKNSIQFQRIDEEPQKQKCLQNQMDKQTLLDTNNYEDLINEPLKIHENQQVYTFNHLTKQYSDFSSQIRFPSSIDYNEHIKEGLLDGVPSIIKQFEPNREVISLPDSEHKDAVKSYWICENIQERLKGQIKIGHPIRKRKNISDKTSQLVKILHVLKQKIVAPGQQPQQKPPIAPSVPTSLTSKPSQTGVQGTSQPPQTKKTLPKKPEQKESVKQVKEKQVKTKKQETKTGGQKGPNKRKKKEKDEEK